MAAPSPLPNGLSRNISKIQVVTKSTSGRTRPSNPIPTFDERLRNLSQLNSKLTIQATKNTPQTYSFTVASGIHPSQQQFISDIAQYMRKTAKIVSKYKNGKQNTEGSFESPYVSILQYETKLNILNQTMIKLREQYENKYGVFQHLYEYNPSDKLEVYKVAIELKNITNNYFKTVGEYILHDQLIKKFWENPKMKESEENYGKLLAKKYPFSVEEQRDYAILYGNALAKKKLVRGLYKKARQNAEKVEIFNYSIKNTKTKQNPKARYFFST